MLSCCHITTNKLRRIDPTRTTSIRRAFIKDVRRRFNKLSIEIKKAIIELDVLNLKKDEEEKQRLKLNLNLAEKQYKFATSREKIELFMEWLNEMEWANILETRRIPALRGRGNRAWFDTYIQSAYRKGIGKAYAELKRLGVNGYEKGVEEGVNVAFNRPFHVDRLGILYTRAFNQLKGIDDEMDKHISGVLAEGLAKGLNPVEMADNIVERVDNIGITRATTLARTEVIRAHAEANLNEFEAAGLEGVNLQAEWLTAGDNNVCHLCLKGEKKNPYTLKEARGVIPRHPNCRCTWVPISKGWNK